MTCGLGNRRSIHLSYESTWNDGVGYIVTDVCIVPDFFSFTRGRVDFLTRLTVSDDSVLFTEW